MKKNIKVGAVILLLSLMAATLGEFDVILMRDGFIGNVFLAALIGLNAYLAALVLFDKKTRSRIQKIQDKYY